VKDFISFALAGAMLGVLGWYAYELRQQNEIARKALGTQTKALDKVSALIDETAQARPQEVRQ
jgi:hypothetical protein